MRERTNSGTLARFRTLAGGHLTWLLVARLVALLVVTLFAGSVRAQSTTALDALPVDQLVGRLLLLAFPGSEPPLERLAEIHPAGFLFYPSNVPSTASVRSLVGALQAASDRPLLYGIDQEGGPFTSYRVDDATIFPGNMALAATGDSDLARQVAEATGEELAYAGFNLSFGPVVDVNINPNNPIIGIRSFGSQVETVEAFGRAYLSGLEAAGVAAVAKHFPGHGDTSTDSHLGLPVVTGDRARLDAVELPPFQAMIAAGVPAIMTAHVAFPAIDPDVPATLSHAALTGLLRGELGFDGLIITDYMDMDAIKQGYGAGEAAVMSVLAGADLVLLGPDLDTQRQVLAALQEAVRSGRLPEARVRDAVSRSLRLAQTYRPQLDAPVPDYAAHVALASEVAAKAATLLWNDDVLPLAAGSKVLVVAPLPSGFGQPPHLGVVLSKVIAAGAGPAKAADSVTSLRVDAYPSGADIEAAVEAASAADVVVLGTYHWLGSFPDGMATLEQRLVATGKPVVVVALGDPDDNRFLPERPAAYLAVYGYRGANLWGAATVLSGRVEPTGVLPVPAGTFSVGAGSAGFGSGG